MIVLVEIGLVRFGGVFFWRNTFYIYAVSVVHPNAVGPLRTESEGVGAWRVGVMNEYDVLAIMALDYGRNNVAELEIDFGIRMILTAMINDVFV